MSQLERAIVLLSSSARRDLDRTRLEPPCSGTMPEFIMQVLVSRATPSKHMTVAGVTTPCKTPIQHETSEHGAWPKLLLRRAKLAVNI